MIEIIHVTGVEAIGGHRLRLRFSDGSRGVHDFGRIVAESGPMIEPLRDVTFFERVFISLGVLTWPNGFDLDAIRLHDEMNAAGELTKAAAA